MAILGTTLVYGNLSINGDIIVNGVALKTPTTYVTVDTAQTITGNKLFTRVLFSSGVQIGNTSTSAGGSSAIAIGSSAIASGNYTVAMGTNSYAASLYGVAIGYYAQDQGGTGNIVIGNANIASSISRGIAIGHESIGQGNQCVAIGNNSVVANFNGVAVGSYAEVDSNSNNGVAVGAYSYVGGTYGVAVGASAYAQYSNSVAVGYNAKGPTTAQSTRIGCGTYSSTGQALLLGSGSTAFTYMNAAGSSWSTASDMRDKTDVSEITHALDFLMEIKPITYVMNSRQNYLYKDENGVPLLDENNKQYYDKEAHERGDKKKHRRFAGVSAQETYSALLNAYGDDNYADIVDNNKYDNPDDEYIEQLSVQYERFIPFLIKAIQEQQKEIEDLKTKLKEQSNNDD